MRNENGGLRRPAARCLAAFVGLGAALSIALPAAGEYLPFSWGYAIPGGYTHTMGYQDSRTDSCANRNNIVATLNGDRIRVCQNGQTQSVMGEASDAFYWPHAPLRLALKLPAANRVFTCCRTGPIGAGQRRPFSDLTTPEPESITYSARDGGLTYATVEQTVTADTSANHGYTITYRVTNTSGAPLRIRPMVYTTSLYGYNSTASTPLQLKVSDSTRGGWEVNLRSSSASGSPGIASYLIDTREDVEARLDPTSILPDQLNTAYSGSQAVEWADHADSGSALPSGSTATYSLHVSFDPPQLMRLELQDPNRLVSPALPPVIRGIVYDRPGTLTGKTLRWRALGAGGTAVVNANGEVAFELPAFSGSWAYVNAYIDLDGDSNHDWTTEPAGAMQVYVKNAEDPSTTTSTTTNTLPTPTSNTSPSPATTAPPVPMAITPTPPAPAVRKPVFVRSKSQLRIEKLTVKVLPTANPKRVRVTVTARGITGRVVKTLRLIKSQSGFQLTGTVKLPRKFAQAKKLRVVVSGKGVKTTTASVAAGG